MGKSRAHNVRYSFKLVILETIVSGIPRDVILEPIMSGIPTDVILENKLSSIIDK